MRRVLVLMAACALLSACSTRALRARDDPWDGSDGAETAAIMGYHGPVERPATDPAN
jgi:uncharacterized protein YceK